MTTKFPANPFRSAFENHARPLVGIWSVLNSSNVVEGLSYSGFDWILIDNEHSPTDLGDTLDHLRALSASDIVPVVRLPWNDPVLIKKYLDIGAQTIMLPFVQTPQEAKAAVAAAMYPPDGKRGYALMHRASRYGRHSNYAEAAKDNVFIIVQLETPAALEHTEEIAKIDGIDAIFFGPGDLSATMGHRGNPAHAEVLNLICEKSKIVKALGKRTGVLAPGASAAEFFIEAGIDFVAAVTDGGLMFSASDSAARHFVSFAEGVVSKGAAKVATPANNTQ
ncbi:HpcH/HpaI aldolase family protein [Cognatishimia maritima]|uniref:2-dehydro-3-deoxyglucarate aldolase n=1 Tax=Cognatishimia maritima TaxID=870908 RepID=A0A1M5QWX8_9RHOB|nr:aldolase/citrate lyase family protein [Cognatishimia maritima]SHH18219.1 2-dehydro-3-deoxyglucarate aldolase [Cognatishimia maritima]